MQSERPPLPSLHVAIVMDGNGRWATARGSKRIAGHRAGADAVRRTVEAACHESIGTLTLYAFSSDNWHRPAEEVSALMELFGRFLEQEGENCRGNDIRLEVIGRRDRLSPSLRQAIARTEALTGSGRRLRLRIAIDYSAREAIVAAAALHSGRDHLTRGHFDELMARALGGAPVAPPVDLFVRTGGEKRLSDFLLWESAYAELFFTDVMWPDFDADDLAEALAAFHSRERRFGRITPPSMRGIAESV